MRTRRGAPLRRTSWVGVALVVCAVLSSCGNRLTTEELHAAALADSRELTGAASEESAGSRGVAADEATALDEVVIGDAGGAADPGAGPSGSGPGAGGGDGSVEGGDGPAAGQSCSGRKSTITIGTVGEQSGVIGNLVANGAKAVQAWVASVNARGGLDCHPVKYLIADDGGDPSRHQALVRQMVEQQGVVAFVHMNAPLAGQAAVGYLTQKGIPVIGSEGGGQWFHESPMYFPQAASGTNVLRVAFASFGTVARQSGKTKLAVISCVEASICSGLNSLAPVEAPKHGMELVYRGQVSLVQPDFTSQCQAAKRAGAELFLIGADTNSAIRLARNCVSVGYAPQYSLISSTAGPQLRSDPRLDGLAVGMPVIPWMITSNPEVQEFRDAIARFAPGLEPDSTTIPGWVSAKLFERAARDLPDEVTPQAILEGLWSINGEDLGGLTQPLTFRRGQNAPESPVCYYTVVLKDGEYSSPDGGKRTCA